MLHVACDKWSNGFVYVKMFTAQDAHRTLTLTLTLALTLTLTLTLTSP